MFSHLLPLKLSIRCRISELPLVFSSFKYLSQDWIAEAHHRLQFEHLLNAREHRSASPVLVGGAFDVGEE